MNDRRIPEVQRRRTRLSDVAMRAGVSSVTVSRVLRRPEMVSADLRERVESAVDELGYIPNRLASALASAQTRTVGVVVPSLTNGVFSDYLRALHDVLLPAGFQVLVLNSRYMHGAEEKAIVTLLGHHPEAMILAGVDQTATARRLLERSGVPVVQTMELADDPIDINIGISQVEAGYAATRYLQDLGHRRIAHMSAPLDARALRRRAAYQRAIEEQGMEPRVIAIERSSSVPLGGELFAQLIERWPDIEAVFCANDNLALGSLFECQRRGIDVPGRISLIGFNDLEFCASAFPAITSVATPRFEMGRLAAVTLLEIVNGSGTRPHKKRIDLGFSISERASTRRRD